MPAGLRLTTAGITRSFEHVRGRGARVPDTILARERWTMSDEYKFGIEEEYFLVDAETKSVAREMPQSFLDQLKSITGGQVRGEMLQSQIEAATAPHNNVADARTELRFLR